MDQSVEPIELLEKTSLWFTTSVRDDDIEHERQQLEATYDRQIALYRVTHEMRSGVNCTLVEWRVL